jgi:hypothetical protein
MSSKFELDRCGSFRRQALAGLSRMALPLLYSPRSRASPRVVDTRLPNRTQNKTESNAERLNCLSDDPSRKVKYGRNFSLCDSPAGSRGGARSAWALRCTTRFNVSFALTRLQSRDILGLLAPSPFSQVVHVVHRRCTTAREPPRDM